MAKLATIIGINAHANPRFDLRGCVNDAESLARLLVEQYGFAAPDIRTLTDGQATRSAILGALREMLSRLGSGDTAVFGFSGHGTEVPNRDAGEAEAKDQCLVAHGSNLASLIRDDELYELVSQYVTGPEIKFTSIYDCCHSGTMYRLFEIDDDGNFAEEVINRHIDLGDLTELTVRTRAFDAQPFNSLSACGDDETAADLRSVGPAGKARGAFSYALHNFLRQNRDAPAAIAKPAILGAIKGVSKHVQNPAYLTIAAEEPLIRL